MSLIVLIEIRWAITSHKGTTVFQVEKKSPFDRSMEIGNIGNDSRNHMSHEYMTQEWSPATAVFLNLNTP